jgi:phosphatidylglycerol:prolipoprotein diacylglycerol transferase
MTGFNLPPFGPASWVVLVSMLVSLYFWFRSGASTRKLLPVYGGALIGAVVGGKTVYLLAQGWLDWSQPDWWTRVLAGKTITGALLGGYLGVELAKKWIGHRQPTGDLFALMVPLSIAVARVSCWLSGCCLGHVCEPSWYSMKDSLGRDRWPAVPVELGFNLMMVAVLALLRHTRRFPHQHFHIYLVAYGLFRFVHEFWRDTPRLIGPLSGYHLASVALVILGAERFWRREQQSRGAGLPQTGSG